MKRLSLALCTSAVLLLVLSCDKDTTPPTVQLVYPAPGPLARGRIQLKATAADDQAVKYVEFWVDQYAFGQSWYPTRDTYTLTWNTTDDTTGAHAIKAFAVDRADNRSTAAMVFVTLQ